MEKLKCIYIICFVLQVISIPFICYLLTPMVNSLSFQHFYCEIDAKGVGENFWKEFRKLFPTDYKHYCHDASFATMGLAIMKYLIWILLAIFLFAYSIIFCLIMRKNKFILNNCILYAFIIINFIFLLPVFIFYIYLTPGKTNFDNPDIIFIFDQKLNDEIKEMMKTVVKRLIYGIIGIFLILIIIATTIIKIYILYKAKKQKNIDEKLKENQISNDSIQDF